MSKELVTSIVHGALTRADPRRLALFQQTVGKSLSKERGEIDQALEWCEIYQANPFVNDIYFFVFDSRNDAKRRVVPVLSIAKYRKIADAAGNYRPDNRPPRFTYDDALKGPGNPRGIVDCTVSAYKFSHGEWHEVSERVRWDERVPLKEHCEAGWDWVNTGEVWEDSKKPIYKRAPRGPVIQIIDPAKEAWIRMPETMISKCTEAAVIRKGWPNETSGSFVPEDLDAAHTLELTATEIIEDYETNRKLARAGRKDAVVVTWGDGVLESIPAGQFADRVLEWAKTPGRTVRELVAWWNNNHIARTDFRALNGSDYLELQKQYEKIDEELTDAERRAKDK